ncbi:MAG: hypothetical protein L3J71_12545 [Victivallaceae bacterium]|nr:hypothetical protein [Victivallaceae bacterium]
MFYRTVLSLLFLFVMQAINVTAADNLLKNPQFSKQHIVKGKQLPKQWRWVTWGKDSKKNVTFTSDSKFFHSGKYAVSIKQTAGTNYCHFTQKVKVTPALRERQLNVSAWIFADNVEFGSIVIIADTAQKKAALWKRIVRFKGSFDWKKFAEQITVPPNINALTLSIRLKGIGMIWADDCAMSFAGEQSSKIIDNALLNGNLLKNPELSGKINRDTGLPQGWQRKYAPGYENRSEVAVTGEPAILQLKWLSGGAKFGVTPQAKIVLPPGNYSLRALTKTSATSQAMLSVGNYKSLEIAAKKWQPVAVDFKVTADNQPEPVYWNLGDGTTAYKNFSLKKIDKTLAGSFPITAIAMPVEINRQITGREEFNSFVDNPVPLAFVFKGKGYKSKLNKLVVEIPAALEITETFNSHPNLNQIEQPEISEIIRNDKPYLRYSYTNPRVFSILKPNFGWERKLVMAIEPATPGLVDKSFPIYWYITSDQRKGEEHLLTMNILPPLANNKMPDNFPILCWGIYDSNFNTAEVLNKVATNFERAGIRYRRRISGLEKQDEFYRKRGWKFFMALIDYYKKRYYGEDFPIKIPLSVTTKGGSHEDFMCPTFFNNDKKFRTAFYGELDKLCRKNSLKDGEMICYDLEPWRPMEWCVCDACRKNFAKQYKLNSVPTVKQLQSKYVNQWRDFRCLQTAKTIKVYTEYFREKFPNSPILDYDYIVKYNTPGYRNYFKSVAKDPLLNEQYFDAHIASYYHIVGSESFDMLKCNIEKLKKPYYVITAIDRLGYLSKKKILSPDQMRLLLLASAVNGAEGFSIFPGMHLDGLMLKMFNQSLPVIGELGKFFKKGSGIDAELQVKPLPYVSKELKFDNKVRTINRPNWSEFFRYRAQRQQQQTLISLFNYNRKKTLFVELGIKLGKGKYTIINVETKQRLVPDNSQSWSGAELVGFTAKVTPENVTFLLIRSYKAADDKIPAITQQAIKQEFVRIKNSANSKLTVFKTRQSSQLSISADDVNGDGEIEVVLSSPINKIWLSPKYSGSVIRWQYNGTPLFGYNITIPQKDRLLCEDRFWLPKSIRGPLDKNYKLISTEITNGQAIVKMQVTLPRQQLSIIKTFTSSTDSKTLTIDYQITNIGKNNRGFSFWVKCNPMFGNNPAKLSTVLDIPLQNGMHRVDKGDGHQIFTVNPKPADKFFKKHFTGTLNDGEATAINLKGGAAITAKFNIKQLSAVYVWCKTNPTMEWFYRNTTVAPGKTWITTVTLEPNENIP